VLLPGTDQDGVMVLAENLRQRVAAAEFRDRELRVGITASIGVACCRGAHANADTLLRAADQALYEAKRLGRDRVVMGDLPGLLSGANSGCP
jgi:diguanylate cyclase (GGDEF)-like protein